MLIEAGKQYLTRSGDRVRILATGVEDLEDGSIVGIIYGDAYTWHEAGNYLATTTHKLDIMAPAPAPKTETRVLYLNMNMYPLRNPVAYSNKQDADHHATSSRIACKRIEVTYEHGEGL